MNNDTVKKNIKKIRKAAGLTQLALAERLGVSKTAYNNLESGDTKLLSGWIEPLADVLHISPEELVLGYKPVEVDAMKVKDIIAENDAAIASLKLKHEKEIAQLRMQIMSLEKLAAAQQETITTQKDIINLLRKNENPQEE